MKLAICGATGLVGRELLNLLSSSEWLDHEVLAFASGASAGLRVQRGTRSIEVQPLSDDPPSGVDYAFFALPAAVSERLAPRWQAAGVRIVDKSSRFRMDPNVPLVVPGVNEARVTAEVSLVATPNCTTIPAALALQPLRALGTIRAVRAASYQAVSGAGVDGLETWEAEVRRHDQPGSQHPPAVTPFGRPIHGNVLPLIGSLDENGHSDEERKFMDELPKILETDELYASCTSVRVPVAVGHGLALEVEFSGEVSLEEATAALRDAPHVDFWQDASHPPTAIDCAGRDEVLVGRLRRAPGRTNSFLIWVVGDNLRVGAATNGLRIVQRWMEL